MEKEHTFWDYIDAERTGNNIIESWLNDGGSSAKANFIIRLEQLEGSKPGGMEDSVWKPNFVKPLTVGKWKKYKDFIEIKVKANNRQYRLIGKRVNRDILLVGWGFHDGKGWHTELTPATAQERAVQMMDTPAKYRREHEL